MEGGPLFHPKYFPSLFVFGDNRPRVMPRSWVEECIYQLQPSLGVSAAQMFSIPKLSLLFALMLSQLVDNILASASAAAVVC